MNQPIISVENLGKAYRIGAKEQVPDTLTQAALGLARAPWRNLQRLRRMNTFSSDPHAETLEDDTIWALRDVSFNVQEGEVVGIIGRNGAGKSTLLKILSRITEPTSGRATIRGRVSSLLEVGTGFHPELTGRENIYMNGTILGMTKREIDRKFDEIVDFSGVEKFLDTPVKRYSSGMQVRVAFAVAAHLEPEILIVDEVLAVGDTEFQKKCMGKMQDVAKGGRTVLFVSHNMAIMRSLCSHGVFMQKGQLKLLGCMESCVSAYMDRVLSHKSGVKQFSDKPHEDSQLLSASVCRESGEPCNSFYYGDMISIQVNFRSNVPTRAPRLGVVISSDEGVRVANANMHYLPFKDLERPCRLGTIQFNFGAIPLMSGGYSVSLWFGGDRVEHEVHHDVLGFSVQEREIWGTGKLPPRQASSLWWPTEITVEAQNGT